MRELRAIATPNCELGVASVATSVSGSVTSIDAMPDARPNAGDRLSATCARALVLRAEAPPRLRVIEDVFNPRGGLFVTRDYDESVWQADRFVAHTVVTVGAANDGPDGPVFEPLIYLGGRADFRTDEGTRRGHLHVGFVMLGDIDVFAA